MWKSTISVYLSLIIPSKVPRKAGRLTFFNIQSYLIPPPEQCLFWNCVPSSSFTSLHIHVLKANCVMWRRPYATGGSFSCTILRWLHRKMCLSICHILPLGSCLKESSTLFLLLDLEFHFLLYQSPSRAYLFSIMSVLTWHKKIPGFVITAHRR